MIGYDVSYERKAFRTKIDSEGIHITALELLLERVAKFVQEQSDGHWIISNKVVVMPSDRTKPVELTVIVPAGTDQYEQYLAAVGLFESRVAAWLTDYPFDTTLRTIEEDSLECGKPDGVSAPNFRGLRLGQVAEIEESEPLDISLFVGGREFLLEGITYTGGTSLLTALVKQRQELEETIDFHLTDEATMLEMSLDETRLFLAERALYLDRLIAELSQSYPEQTTTFPLYP